MSVAPPPGDQGIVPLPPPPPGVPLPPGVPGVPLPPGAPGFFPVAVARPTKPKIVLKAKVKQLQWNRVLLMPENSPNRPNLIWNQIKEPKMDIDEVIFFFGVKKKGITKGRKETKNRNKEVFRPKENSRSFNYCNKITTT